MSKKRNFIIKKILLFFIFQIIFTAITFPILVFYGPFEVLKSTVVASTIYSTHYTKVAGFFLSNEKIKKLIEVNIDEPPTDNNPTIISDKNKSFSDKIEIRNIEGGYFKGKLMIIHNPKRLIVGYSSKIPQAGETTSAIAKKYKAIAAINAGGFVDTAYVGTGGRPMGIIMQNGKMIFDELKNENLKQNIVGFTDAGALIVGKYTMKKLKSLGIKEAVSFDPALVINGKPTIKSGNGGRGNAPRTAIGQRADGAVIFLVTDGRSYNCIGATLRDIQDIMLQNKAVNAGNLDGGSSTTMYYNGRILNNTTDVLGERAVPTVFMVGTDETLSKLKEVK